MDRDDTVQVVGKRADGTEEVIGTAPMPPGMKARELVREMFGSFQECDGSDADLAMACCEQLLEYIGKTQFAISPAPAQRDDSVSLPQNAAQAELMAKAGIAWLQQHAPERLKQPASEEVVLAELGDECQDMRWPSTALAIWRKAERHHGIGATGAAS